MYTYLNLVFDASVFKGTIHVSSSAVIHQKTDLIFKNKIEIIHKFF